MALNDNNWHTMTFHLTAAEFIDPNFDPTKVVQIGVHIATPSSVAPRRGGPAVWGCTADLGSHRYADDELTSTTNRNRQDANERSGPRPEPWRWWRPRP